MTLDPTPAWQPFADLLDPPVNPYVSDPVGWVRCGPLGEFLWSKQREVLEAVRDHRYVAVKSAHDTGKSLIGLRLVCWWEKVMADPFATKTAPTTKQVHAILWRYIGQAHRKGKLVGRTTLDDEWYAGPGHKELVGFGRKQADTEQSAFQGIHALTPLIVVDEACGVPKSIFDAVDSLATNNNARVLAIATLTTYRATSPTSANPGPGGMPPRSWPSIPRRTRVRRYLRSCFHCSSRLSGSTSARSAGALPHRSTSPRCWVSSPTSVITPCSCRSGSKPPSAGRCSATTSRISGSTSPATETTSRFRRREGPWARVYKAFTKNDTMKTVGHIRMAKRDIDVEPEIQEYATIVVDEVGIGAGPYDRLIELGEDAVGFNCGERPLDTERFLNRRAELYWMLREMFERGESDIDPDDEDLAAQLGAVKWTVDSRGHIKIESKDDIRKRGLLSPDRADALCYTLVDPGPRRSR